MEPERWQQIERLYHAALERAEDQRAAFLRDACSDDDALRREVESLLVQESGAGGLLDRPLLEAAAKMLEPLAASLIGRQLGHYQVISLLGVGGMGEVYEALDTKLGRDVAIKVLPERFSSDSERLARFQREARLLAALNHPNIATIHGLEQSDGIHYLVMELVPGETLAEKTKREGALPIEEALKITKQMAEALEAAQERSIIHRDLKPANVKVTPEGRVKVLDFGLAKAFAAELRADETLSALPTAQGVIMGTVGYMSPEQARGQELTKATDLWAFGCILFEILTGKRVFGGEGLTDILVEVVKTDPDWKQLPEQTPPSIRRLLQRCLRKDRRHRLQDATGARLEIEEGLEFLASGGKQADLPGIIQSSGSPAVQSAPASAPSRKQKWVPLVGVSALALIAIAGILVWLRRPFSSAPKQVSRFAINLAPGQRLAAVDQPSPALAISPDGSRLAYVANQGGRQQQVYIRNINSLAAVAIPESEGGYNPFFASDGKSIAFFVEGTLKKVSVGGGSPVSVASVPRISLPMGGAWAADGSFILGFGNLPILERVPAEGSAAKPFTTLDSKRGETSHMWPSFLPGDQALLYTVERGPNTPNLTVERNLATGEQRELITGGSRPIYVASGHIVYADQNNLMAAPFDVKQLRVTGPPVAVVQGVMRCQQCGGGQFDIAKTGALVYIPEVRSAADRHIVWVDRMGKEEPISAAPGTYGKPELSPDGKRIALASEGQIRIYDIARDSLTQVTAGTNPTWSADGQRVAYQRQANGDFNVFMQKADGTGEAEQLTTGSKRHAPGAFSGDGRFLAYTEVDPASGSDIWILTLADHKAKAFVTDPKDQSAPKFSPDGRWLVYTSDESGVREIFLRSASDTGRKLQISTDGGVEPLWNHNGREIFYWNGDQVMAVDINTSPSLSAGKPHQLFAAQYVRSQGNLPNWDVSSDGQHFAMLRAVELNVTQLNVVLNWFEELRQRVSTADK
jgi:serine/threonine protein kinase/Tol biopolymer transport system component